MLVAVKRDGEEFGHDIGNNLVRERRNAMATKTKGKDSGFMHVLFINARQPATNRETCVCWEQKQDAATCSRGGRGTVVDMDFLVAQG